MLRRISSFKNILRTDGDDIFASSFRIAFAIPGKLHKRSVSIDSYLHVLKPEHDELTEKSGLTDTDDEECENECISTSTPAHHSSHKLNRKNAFKSRVPQMCNDIARFVENKVLVKKSLSGSFSSLTTPSCTPKDGNTSLINAIRSRSINRVRLLLETQPVDVNLRDAKGVTAMHEAAICGQCDTLQLLVRHNATLTAKDNEGLTCLDYAVFGGHFECAKYLIDCGASVENIRNGVPTHFGKTNFA